MAEDEAEENGTEEDEAGAEGDGEAKKGSKKLLFIIGGIVLLLILIAVPLGIFLSMGGEEEEVDKESKDGAASKQELVLLMEGFNEDEEAEEKEALLGAFYPFETFVVNLSGGGYLRCQAIVEFEKRDIPKQFYSKLVPVRDALINVLSNQSRRDLGDEEARADLKAEMRDIINEKLRKKMIEKVYFTQFVIQ